MRIGAEMWSEYFAMIDFSRLPSSSSSSPSRRCSVTSVPLAARVAASTENSPPPSLIQRTASSAGVPARRVTTVTWSATMKLE